MFQPIMGERMVHNRYELIQNRQAYLAQGHLYAELPPFVDRGVRGLPCGDARPREMDPEDWFPISGGQGAGRPKLTDRNLAAQMLCRQCPVADECLDWALESGQPDGIWGAMTAGERELILRGRTRRQRTVQLLDRALA